MAKLRRRFTIIDHEQANTQEVSKYAYVLSPAKNPADLAALYTLMENVEPELAQDIRDAIKLIESVPHRGLGSYGKECLPHITHPAVKPFAQQRLAQLNAPIVPKPEDAEAVAKFHAEQADKKKNA
jgi:hypothetical protein